MHPCMQSIVGSIRIVYMSRGYILIDIFRLHFASDTALRQTIVACDATLPFIYASKITGQVCRMQIRFERPNKFEFMAGLIMFY